MDGLGSPFQMVGPSRRRPTQSTIRSAGLVSWRSCGGGIDKDNIVSKVSVNGRIVTVSIPMLDPMSAVAKENSVTITLQNYKNVMTEIQHER